MLDQILGQEVPVAILKRALSTDSLGHAYLFSGDEGVGKETVARAVAQEVLKNGGPLSELHVLGGTESIKVDQIRMVRQKAALAASGSSVWIILDAERLTPEAANAFLKTLEEPPQGTYFLLTTTKVQSILPTILSRCQHLAFRPLAEEQVCTWLAQKTGRTPDDDRVRAAAKLSQGSLGRAWAYWEGALLEARAEVIEKVKRIPQASYPEVLGLSQRWPEDRQQVLQDLQLFLEWHRDLLLVKNGVDLPLYNPGYERELQAISELYTNRDLLKIIDTIMEMGKAIAGNGRVRFCLGYLFLMMKRGALT